jgi:hypothetical protein
VTAPCSPLSGNDADRIAGLSWSRQQSVTQLGFTWQRTMEVAIDA